jgi:hypothetical protein|tara:strand:- start:542 stop:835 length:294 start_codon:yes stop_codon:yes gene_type:complete
MATKKENVTEKKYFFGWTNIKWGIKEIINVYSINKSFFSKKRVESGIAFIIAQWGMIYFLLNKVNFMTTTDMVMWAGIEFAISGYIINQIQKEKKED